MLRSGDDIELNSLKPKSLRWKKIEDNDDNHTNVTVESRISLIQTCFGLSHHRHTTILLCISTAFLFAEQNLLAPNLTAVSHPLD
jgi:hypothetical protein